MLKKNLTIVVALFWAVAGEAQTHKVWTLEDCIRYAEEHSIDIRKQILSTDRSELNLQEGKWAFVPSLSASSGYTASTGRVLDPTTYQFVQTNLTSNSSSSIDGSIALFEGGRKLKNLERAKLSLKASLLEEESVRYNLRLNVIAAYMDVLCAGKQVEIARKTAGLIEEQLARSQNLLEAGSITESDVLQLRSQSFAAGKDVSSAIQSERMAKLTICGLLEIEEYELFTAEEPSASEEYQTFVDMEPAIESNPEYQTSVMNRSLAEVDYRIAKSALYPSLSLSVGYGSSWSDARKKTLQNSDGTVKYEAYPFFQQYADNASAYVSLGLKIPIFTGFSSRNNVKRAEMAVKEAELAALTTRKQVRKRIIQAQIDCETAQDRYVSAQAEVRYAKEAQRQINDKYNLGTTDFNSWNTAVVEMAKAEYNLAEAECTLIMKYEVLMTYVDR